MNIKLCELFAGTGGFSIAFKNVFGDEIKTVYANDILPESKQIYDLNVECALSLGDLHAININDIPNFDILTAGFSCQPFSIAGKQKGFNDDRANVIWKLFEIIKNKQPQIFILENVKNIISHDNGNTFNTIIKHLTDLQYYIKYSVLDTCKITPIPQHRERVYIIGFRNKSHCDMFNFDFPKIECNKISSMLENEVQQKYYYTDRFKVWNTIKESVTKSVFDGAVYQYRRYYVRENKNNVCPTLTQNAGSGGHNTPIIKDDVGIRKITPRECFNLQGFPNDYIFPSKASDSTIYKLSGNAITVPVVMLICKKLHDILKTDLK